MLQFGDYIYIGAVALFVGAIIAPVFPLLFFGALGTFGFFLMGVFPRKK